nr:MAG TPA: hypothetical protein [Bacteriophage sp.]
MKVKGRFSDCPFPYKKIGGKGNKYENNYS